MSLMLVLCGLVLVSTPVTLQSQTYLWKDDVTDEPVTCDKCPPGTRVLRHCTRHSRTACAPCPALHYTEFWNYLEQCRYCNNFCADTQLEKQPCSSTHNRLCECKAGYYLRDEMCAKHSACPPGEGVAVNGTAYEDAQCELCPDGFYSSVASSTQRCLQHSQCQPEQRAIEGDEKQDTFCTACTTPVSIHTDSAEAIQICSKAIMEYVAHQSITPRKLRKLRHIAERKIQQNGQNMGNKSLLELFQAIAANEYNDKKTVDLIFSMLQKANLTHLQKKVMRLFIAR
ncbi:tumor necrosis factor receptor superfamily member 6B [Amia ocellicauda]|uniref:tumor necrosis factor receptor superfamily member 6B n=1 Tax=Amia ocellicauda TaxID=2972642 RepID=UPI00346421FF|nr:TNF6B factor [Amia calva]